MGTHRGRVQLGMDGMLSVSYCHNNSAQLPRAPLTKSQWHVTIIIYFITRSASFSYSGLDSATLGWAQLLSAGFAVDQLDGSADLGCAPSYV